MIQVRKEKHVIITNAVVDTVKTTHIILKPMKGPDVSHLIYPEQFPHVEFKEGEMVRVHIEYGDIKTISNRPVDWEFAV